MPKLSSMGKIFKIYKLWHYRPFMLIEAFILLNKWDKTIKQSPYASWKHHLASKVPSTEETSVVDEDNPSQIKEIHQHLQVIVRNHYKHMNCLRRCLALKDMLEKRHTPCKIHIGVKLNEQGTMAAHSWVSVNNEVINDSPQEVSKYKEITQNNTLFANSNLLS